MHYASFLSSVAWKRLESVLAILEGELVFSLEFVKLPSL